MLNKKLVHKIFSREKSLSEAKRALHGLSADILTHSKRVIFAFHRSDEKTAQELLKTAQKKLDEAAKMVKREPLLRDIGSYRAAREEFTEAHLLSQYLTKGKIDVYLDPEQDPEIFIGGLSDFVGELVRQAVLSATKGEDHFVERFHDSANEVVEYLLQMDLTGSLRTKADQAKSHLRKLEEIRYDLSLRRK